jgi:integrase
MLNEAGELRSQLHLGVVRPWEPAELGVFLEQAGSHRFGARFELIALAELRRGEACGLRWSDVELSRGFLVVRQQVVQVDHLKGHRRQPVARGQLRTESSSPVMPGAYGVSNSPVR